MTGMTTVEQLTSNLVLEEGDIVLLCTRYVINVRTPRPEAAGSCTRFVADHAVHRSAAFACRIDIHQRTVHRLVHFVRPQCAVEVYPLVRVKVQQPTQTTLTKQVSRRRRRYRGCHNNSNEI